MKIYPKGALIKSKQVIATARNRSGKQSRIYDLSVGYRLPRRYVPRNDGINQHFPKSTHSLCSGFTLVEVLVAAAILAVGLMGVASMIARSTVQDARAYYTSHASVMVEEFIEDESVKQLDSALYRQINGTNGTVTRTISGVTYSMNCTVTADAPIDNCREMNCTVRWNNKGLQSQMEYIYVFAPKY